MTPAQQPGAVEGVVAAAQTALLLGAAGKPEIERGR